VRVPYLETYPRFYFLKILKSSLFLFLNGHLRRKSIFRRELVVGGRAGGRAHNLFFPPTGPHCLLSSRSRPPAPSPFAKKTEGELEIENGI